MAINVKAVFNFTATAAVTTSWSVTASTSINVGDTLLLHLGYRGGVSASVSAVTDSGGNTWTRIGGAFTNTTYGEAWFAPVTGTAANFQIAIATQAGKTLSARAATLIVVSGAHATTPIDLGSIKALNNGAASNTTVTVSTSLTTTADSGMLFVAVAINNELSVTMAAAVEWTGTTTPVKATGGFPVALNSFQRAISSQAIYAFSASLSIASSTPSRLGVIYGVRAAAAGPISGATDVTFSPVGTLVATAATISGAATVQFSPVATAVGKTSLSGVATVAFALVATGVVTAASLSGAAVVTFAPVATAAAAAAPLSGATDVTFAPVATGTATAESLSGAADVTFGATGTIADAGAGGVAGASNVVFGVFGSASADVAVDTGQPYQTAGGHGRKRVPFDPTSFRAALEQARREILSRARQVIRSATHSTSVAAAVAPVIVQAKEEAARQVSAVAQRALAMQIASARQVARLRDQERQLQAMQAQLQVLEARILDEEEDDELLMMVA